jgi:hypothetical protein
MLAGMAIAQMGNVSVMLVGGCLTATFQPVM